MFVSVRESAYECVFVFVLSAQGRFLSALPVSNDDTHYRRICLLNFLIQKYKGYIEIERCYWGCLIHLLLLAEPVFVLCFVLLLLLLFFFPMIWTWPELLAWS